nr:MAG TPA: Baseplate wedge protein [Caudoviricetes sp.]
MENKYLNLTGAVYIISKIKTLLRDKSDKGHTHSKEEIGLGNVENKSSQTIRGELTSDNVIKALGYTPPKENTTYSDATQTAHGLMSVSDKKKLDGIAEGANKTTVDSELSNTSTNPVQNKAVQAELAEKAPIASPSFTGTPKVPTASAGTNNTQAASTAFVTSAISTAMAGITKLDFQVVQTLPSTGVKGTFYLIANSGSGQNVYDEYLWINNKYEKLGTREIDLSSYIKQSDMVAITNSEIDAAFA